MELIAQRFISPRTLYSPQAYISIRQNGNALFVSAGGTLSNNTYKWFSVEKQDTVTIAGDSVFHPSQTGHYYAAVTNSVCTKLTLSSDTIFYNAFLQDSLSLVDLYKALRVLPGLIAKTG